MRFSNIRLGPARATRWHHFFEHQARRRPDARAVDFVATGQRLLVGRTRAGDRPVWN